MLLFFVLPNDICELANKSNTKQEVVTWWKNSTCWSIMSFLHTLLWLHSEIVIMFISTDTMKLFLHSACHEILISNKPIPSNWIYYYIIIINVYLYIYIYMNMTTLYIYWDLSESENLRFLSLHSAEGSKSNVLLALKILLYSRSGCPNCEVRMLTLKLFLHSACHEIQISNKPIPSNWIYYYIIIINVYPYIEVTVIIRIWG